MSTAAGYHFWYKADELFMKEFGELKKDMGQRGHLIHFTIRIARRRSSGHL
ncbi:hypothetical protein [Peptococcaceae bacterium]